MRKLLTLFALACMVPVMAQAEVLVTLTDENNVPLEECTGTATDIVTGDVIYKFEPAPDGRYYVPAVPGMKLLFNLYDDFGTYLYQDVVPPVGGIHVQLAGPPANDDCAAPIPLNLPDSTSGDTSNAATDPEAIGAVQCGTSITNPSKGVWYSVIGDGSTITANTCAGSQYDTKLHAYCQDCDALQCLAGNDDTCGLQSQVSFCSEAGVEYRIFVHGFSTASGFFTLDVSSDGVSCVPDESCLPPTPTGACCNCLAPPFNCEILTEEECLAQGGDYLGDDTECFQQGASAVNAISPGLAIPDGNSAGVDSILTVPEDLTIGDLDVDLQVTHTFQGDLIVRLTHPSGEPTVTLWDQNCGGNNDIDVTFDDAGDDLQCSQPTQGTYNTFSISEQELAAFNGLSSAGNWTLNISDNIGADTGTLDAWGLTISEQGPPNCPDISGGGGGDCPGDDEDEDADDSGGGHHDDGDTAGGGDDTSGSGGSQGLGPAPSGSASDPNTLGATEEELDREPVRRDRRGSSNRKVDRNRGR